MFWSFRAQLGYTWVSVLRHHVYRRWQLELDRAVEESESRKANDLSASYFDNWVFPTSIINHIVVVYADIGKESRNGRTHKELLEEGTFFL